MKDYIDKIVKNGKQEDMDCLEDILIDSLYSIKENDYRKFKEYCEDQGSGAQQA